MSGDHLHKCDTCNTTWKHPDKCYDNYEDHHCPNCEEGESWTHYHPRNESRFIPEYVFVKGGEYKRNPDYVEQSLTQ